MEQERRCVDHPARLPGKALRPAKSYPPGVPCWVEALAPDPRAALDFYRALFGWVASGPESMPGGDAYYVARLNGADVAGVATLPPDGIAEPAWTIYVSVADLARSTALVRSAGGSVVVEPLDVRPAGRLAIVAGPADGTFGLWEPGERAGAQRVNEPGCWAMSTLRTRSLDAALPFYETVFGWHAQPGVAGATRGVVFRAPNDAGGGDGRSGPGDVVAAAIEDRTIAVDHWSVDFRVDDMQTALRCAGEHGGRVIRAPFDAAPFRRAVVACPAGAVFTLSASR